MTRLALVLTVCVSLLLGFAAPALAGDAAAGAQVFANNCAACHAGGGNVVNGAKTLKLADLESYGMKSLDAIMTQVRQGKAAMPSFSGRLSDQQIEDVATYVLDQADKGW